MCYLQAYLQGIEKNYPQTELGQMNKPNKIQAFDQTRYFLATKLALLETQTDSDTDAPRVIRCT